ncbi:hypothetical protein ACOME3_004295 [Neoechinorhynchus agilis]
MIMVPPTVLVVIALHISTLLSKSYLDRTTNTPRLSTSSSTYEAKPTSEATVRHAELIPKDTATTEEDVNAVANFKTMAPTSNLPSDEIPPEIQLPQLTTPATISRLPTSSSSYQANTAPETMAHHAVPIPKDEITAGEDVKAVTITETMIPTTNLPSTKIPPEIQFTQLVDTTNAPRLPTSSSTHKIKSTSETTAHHVVQILKDEANTGKGVKAVTNFETMMPTKGSSEEGGNVNKMWETLLLILLLILIPILLVVCLAFFIHEKRKNQSESYSESSSVSDSELSGTNTETTKAGKNAYQTYFETN